MTTKKLYFCVFALTLLCCQAKGPQDINFGQDQCHFCKMTISDPKFGAELITNKGRVLKYDAAECLINHLDQEDLRYRNIYAIAYDQPRRLVNTDSLSFVISSEFRSPMGANLASFSSDQTPHLPADLNLLSWNDTYKIITSAN